MPYDIVVICAETCCINADLLKCSYNQVVNQQALWWNEEKIFSGFDVSRELVLVGCQQMSVTEMTQVMKILDVQ